MISVVERGLFRADLTTLSVGPLMLQRDRGMVRRQNGRPLVAA
jgi:hypothetical protein